VKVLTDYDKIRYECRVTVRRLITSKRYGKVVPVLK